MLRLFPRLMLVVGIGLAAAACLDDGSAAPRGYYQSAPAGYYGGPYYNSGYYSPAPAPYGYYSQPSPYYYANQRANYGTTTVTVTNRGQHGHRDDVVQQRVACGSQYFDGYQQRIARC